jgi:hypothetical protein
MTHMGEGSWTSFRNAVASGVADGDELGDAVRLLSNTLADLGHADFFVGETQYWRINPATLAGLETPPDSAMLIGARTPQMLEMLFDAAEDERCSVTCRNSQSIPTAVYVSGDENSLVRVAASIGIGFVPRFSRKIIGTSEPIQSLFDRAPIESAPTNWRVRSLDFSALSWVDKLLPNSACEYSPRHGRPRWYVHTRHGRLHVLPKREAIYAAAMVRKTPLIQYDAARSQLSCPASAALPVSLSRAASLCSGARGNLANGVVTFGGITPTIATLLCVAAGQACPRPAIVHSRSTPVHHG